MWCDVCVILLCNITMCTCLQDDEDKDDDNVSEERKEWKDNSRGTHHNKQSKKFIGLD